MWQRPMQIISPFINSFYHKFNIFILMDFLPCKDKIELVTWQSCRSIFDMLHMLDVHVRTN